MKKPLSLYQAQLVLLSRERVKLDHDFAQVLAEAVLDGHRIIDVLDYEDDPKQEVFASPPGEDWSDL